MASKKKIFTKDEIAVLSANPNVKHCRYNRLTLTYEFRLKLYEEWIKNPGVGTIRRVMNENGIDTGMIGCNVISHITEAFKVRGKPTFGTNNKFGINASSFKTDQNDNDFLISTGMFVKGRKGIKFSDEFVAEVSLTFPDVSIEDKLKEKGIDPDIVGYQRIQTLKRKLLNVDYTTKEKTSYSKELIDKYSGHPYVKRLNHNQFTLIDSFYVEAKPLLPLGIDEILAVFDMDSNDFPCVFKVNVLNRIRNGEYKNYKPVDDISIMKKRCEAMEKVSEASFAELKDMVKSSSKLGKKEVVKLINEEFDKSKIDIAYKLGISKSSFYSILKNDEYGKKEALQNIKDEEDYRNIRKVLDSDPYPMGKRMVYMKMDDICGFHYSVRKISRLMNIFGSACKVRESKESNKATRELIKRNTKPNLLKRRFRIGKPGDIKLTDVTYIKYGVNKTAYKSTIKDAVSGKIDACVVSEVNDINLVLDTLDKLDVSSLNGDTIFHSDQGILYMTDSFQDKVKELGLSQSMSKRGNSQDNASMESYFGHFKDECNYSLCSDIKEVIDKIDKYTDYYNNRRPQWSRNKMTPIEYENYLLSLDDEEYDLYIKMEEKKYSRMKEKAKKLAIERNRTLGV
ncbi:MAG: IS3 family transposase [Erysipelotrichaceae bacterium]